MFVECKDEKIIPLKTTFFSEEDFLDLDRRRIPHHVAIMMDGNRRWSKKNDPTGLRGVIYGYWQGASALKDIVKGASEIGIKVLTVWGFSTDNWRRPRYEVEAVLQIIEHYIKENLSLMVEQGVRFQVIGDLTPFSSSLKKEIAKTMEATKENRVLDLVIALNYSGREEILRAVKSLATSLEEKKICKEEIDEKLISRYLDTASWPDPELVIRTSKEMRLSNFFLWQAAYAELYMTETLWPDFTPHHLLEAVLFYQKRERRFGR